MNRGRPIVSDPSILNGVPHIEGTTHTVAALQAFWRQPGIGAVAMRKAFPDLTGAELGAAVTWAEPLQPEHEFVADWDGPPQRRLTIYGDFGNWMFERWDVDHDAPNSQGWDVWEDSFRRIRTYAEKYASRDLVWRHARSGVIVDIYTLKFERAD